MNHAILTNVSTDCNLDSSSVCRDDCNNYCDVDSNSTRLLHTDNTNNRVSSDEPKSTHEPKLHPGSDFVIQSNVDPACAIMGNEKLNKDNNERSDTTKQTEPSHVSDKKTNSHYYRNREKILAYAKIRYRENREKLLAYSKQYQSERKDRVKERNDQYYAKNKERLLRDRSEKITCCDCGKTITKGSLSGHLKTKYHLKRVEQNKAIDDKTEGVCEQVANTAMETI